ncbi:MAG: anti-sigma F factor antagonist [Thermincolia bacterium]
MQLEFQHVNNTLIVRVSGELDLAVSESFRNEVEGALERQDVQNLILNLKEVSFIDSSGLGVILGRYKRITQVGGNMAIAEAEPQVRRILELSGILRIMGVFETETAALDAV